MAYILALIKPQLLYGGVDLLNGGFLPINGFLPHCINANYSLKSH